MVELYKKVIWRHYQHPCHQGKLKSFDRQFNGANPYCGDWVVFYLKFDRHNKIRAVGWEGQGCAVSRAAASLFSEMIQGKTLAQAQKIGQEEFIKELQEEFSPTRLKCALLPLYTIKEQELD